MKKIMIHSKSYLAVILGVLLFTACTKNFETINTPHKDATTASTPELFNLIISSLPLTGGEQSVFNSWIYPITQQAIVTSGAYPYDNAKSAVWSNYYQTLANYRLVEQRIADSAGTRFDNMYAMLKTVMAYKTFKTSNYYGDMPLQGAGYAPLKGADGYKVVYESQQDIYKDILADLDWAVAHLSSSTDQYSVGAYETLFDGDLDQWLKFANSLRLVIAVTMYDKDPSTAATEIKAALAAPLLADGEDVGLWPSKISGLEFDWRQWSFSANCYLRMGTTMWDLMSDGDKTDGSQIFDPRCKIFYEPNNSGEWVPYPQNPPTGIPAEGGAPYDTKRFTDWDNKGAGCIYSPVNLYFEQDIDYIPELFLTAAQVHLFKAEIYNRGLGVTANQTTAQTEYEAGIKASVNMWTGIAFNSTTWKEGKPAAATVSQSVLNTLLANAKVKYETGDASASLKKIYAQLWIDQYRQPWDAWTLQRRTGNKTPMSTTNPNYYNTNFAGKVRFVYPDDEQSYNTVNWRAATNGSDLNTSKIWIMP
ncbi:Starch-binding associating with outer membrane [Arachidicoccus rhizosphaerae]|uniref:Starch-binding associating with outer membrane n=1 Tax=Arachidicoccus rhizosphaerae TaxID=551991 RepID=A0A1H4ABV3_9BACT|nr:SusD/RagB family nutrient-binding outer membrane lipoprotein [Arachidicoccus rhizosphaerae]SEA33613.1 Starch-binding associating with outer membrane [Arachidicoccus rhizosphaerae]